MTNKAKNTAAIGRFLKSAKKYNLTIRSFKCAFDKVAGVFVYTLSAARRNSGSRGGYLRNHRYYQFINLYPEQRALIEALPFEKGI